MNKFCPNCGGSHWEKNYYALPSCPFRRQQCTECNGLWHTSESCRRFHHIKETGRAERGVDESSSSASREISSRSSNEPRMGEGSSDYGTQELPFCNECSRSFSTRSALFVHIREEGHNRKFKKEQASYPNSTTSANFHRPPPTGSSAAQPAPARFQCHLCANTKFNTKAQLIQHSNDKHKKHPEPNGINFRCPIAECPSGFTRLDDLKQHLATCSFFNSGDGGQIVLGQKPGPLGPARHPSNVVDTHTMAGTLRESNMREHLARLPNFRSVPTAETEHSTPEQDLTQCKICQSDGVPHQWHLEHKCPRAGPPCLECNGVRDQHRALCPLRRDQQCSWCSADGIPGQFHSKIRCPNGGAECSECGFKRNQHRDGCSAGAIQERLKRKRSLTDQQSPATSFAALSPGVHPDRRPFLRDASRTEHSARPTNLPVPSNGQYPESPARRVRQTGPSETIRRHLRLESPRRPSSDDTLGRRIAWASPFGEMLQQTYVARGRHIPDDLWERFLKIDED